MENLLKATVLTITAFISSVIPQPTFIEGVVGQPKNLNPVTVAANQIDRDIVSLVFEGLVKYDGDGHIVPALASSWEVSGDRREYTFKLRKEVFWHDGAPFTADDVLFTVSKSPQLREIPVDKLDNYTVRFRLKEPLSPLLDILTLGIIPSHLDEESNTRPIGTGPFRVLKVKKDDRIRELALQGNGRKLVFHFYETKNDLETAAKLGEIDGYVAAEGEAFTPWPTFNYFKSPLVSRYYALFFNLDSTATIKNKELRQDLAKATPKEKIINETLTSLGEIVNGPLDGTRVENPDYPRFSFNQETTKEYETQIVLTIPDKEVHFKTAKIIKERWSKLGVTLKIKPISLDSLGKVLEERDFEAILLGQEVRQDPDRYTLWHSTQTEPPGLNFTGLKQVRIDRALEEGRKTSDPEERKEHYYHFQEVLAEEVPAIFLYRPVFVYGVKRGIMGVDLRKTFTIADRFWNFEQWKL